MLGTSNLKVNKNSTHGLIIHNNKSAIFLHTLLSIIPLIYRSNMIPVSIPASTIVAIDRLKMDTQRSRTTETNFCGKNKE